MVQVPQGMETLALKLKLVVFLYISGFHYKAMTQHIKPSFAMQKSAFKLRELKLIAYYGIKTQKKW